MDSVWETDWAVAVLKWAVLVTTAQAEVTTSCTALKRYVDEKQLIRSVKDCMYWKRGWWWIRAAAGPEQKPWYSAGAALFLWGPVWQSAAIINFWFNRAARVQMWGKQRDNPCPLIGVQPTLFGIGRTETKSPQGGNMRFMTRNCQIQDLIRDKRKWYASFIPRAIKDYFKMALTAGNYPNTESSLESKNGGQEHTWRYQHENTGTAKRCYPQHCCLHCALFVGS